jgi:Glycoside hydrolase family 5 C-terminal domain
MSELSNLIQALIRNNKGTAFLEITNLLLSQISNANDTNISKFREQLSALLNITSSITTYLPKDVEFIKQFESCGVFSFHYYDPWTLFYSLLNIPDDMHNKLKEWPTIFEQMRQSAISRDLIPFLTEFGGNQDWERLKTDLQPDLVYHGKQIRAYMNLQFIQIENFLLNSTYWNYDLYNTQQGKDNWNLENFSLLGPNRESRNLDIVARPYPIQSSAKPELLFFDLGTKHFALILKGPVVDAPTVIYVPFNMHYAPNFEVRATSNAIEWNKESQLLSWYPDNNLTLNQLIIAPKEKLDTSILPSNSRALLEKTTYTNIFF